MVTVPLRSVAIPFAGVERDETHQYYHRTKPTKRKSFLVVKSWFVCFFTVIVIYDQSWFVDSWKKNYGFRNY